MNPLAEQSESYTAGATAYLEFLEGRTAAARLPRDGDKDGRIFDGTKREMPAPVAVKVPKVVKDAIKGDKPVLKADRIVEDGPFAGLGQVSPELQARRDAAESERKRVAERWAEMYPDGDFVASGGVDTSGFDTLTPEQSKLTEAKWVPLTGNVAYLSYEEEGFEWGDLVRDLPPEQLAAIGRAALLGMSPAGRGELARVGGRTGELLSAGEWDPAIDRVLMPGGLSTTTEIYRYPPDWMLETVFEYEALAREASAPGYVETAFGGTAGNLSSDQLDKVRGLRRRLMAQDEVSPEDQQKIDVLSAVLKGESDLPDFAIYTFMADYFRDEAQKRVDATSAAFGDGTLADGYAHNIDEAFAIVGASVMAAAIGSWAGDSNRFGLIPLERGVADEFGVPYTQNPGLSEAVQVDTDALYDASPEAWRTAARRIYDRTQAILEAQGITEALLYRGVSNSKTGPFDSPLTSWSVSPNVAGQFTADKKYQTRVPAERIFAGPMTGLGKSEEAEVVLLPGDGAVAEVPAHGTGQPRMFDTWLDWDDDVDDALSAKPVLKSNAMVEERLNAPTTEPLFRVKGGEWQASLEDIDASDESKVEVLLPGSRPGDKPVPLDNYPFYRDDPGGAETAWVRGPSEPMTTAAADLTGQSDMPSSGWWGEAEDEDSVTFGLTKELLSDVQGREVSSLLVWSGQSGSVTFQEAEAGDIVAVPLIGVAPSRSTAEWYSRFRNTRGWFDEPIGRLALRWEQGDATTRAEIQAAVSDPTLVPLLLGGNRTLRTEPATGTDRNVVVQFDTSKVSPIDLGEGITSGRYRVKSVQEVPDPDGLAYWNAEAQEFRHTPARLVTVEFVEDLPVVERDRKDVEQEVLLKSNAMSETVGLDEATTKFVRQIDRGVQSDRLDRPESERWRSIYDSQWKQVPDRVRDWALRAGGLQAFDPDAPLTDDASRVVAGAQLYVDLIDTETVTDFPLWRGDPYIKGRQVGDTFVEIRGFSADPATARRFRSGGWLYKIEPGDARVVSLDTSSDGRRLIGEKEVVVGGTFEVTAVDRDNKTVTLRQTAPLPESELARQLRRSGDTIVDDLGEPEVLSLAEPVLTANAISETDDARALGWTIPVDAPKEYWGTDYQLDVPEAPTEQDLVDAVQEWVVNDPDELREQLQAVTLQTGLGPWADDVARRNRRRTAALLNALETQGETTDYELLRGITIDDPYMGGLEGVMMDLPNVGRVIDLPISGFSGRKDVAERFAEVGYYNPDNDWVSVIYHLEPGAKALEMNRIYNPGYSEGEMMVGGRFEVTGKRIDEAEGVVHIFLKQTETIGAAPSDGPAGEWR